MPPPRLFDLAVVGGLFVADVVAQAVVTAGGKASSSRMTPLAVALAAIAAAIFWWRR